MNPLFGQSSVLRLVNVVTMVVVSSLFGSCSDTESHDTPTRPGLVLSQIPGYEQVNDSLFSQQARDTYPLTLYLPLGHADAVDGFPVVYMLDGDTLFTQEIVAQILPALARSVILVGIGNSASRNRDYAPSPNPPPPGSPPNQTGGAIHFYRFITQELIPYIDAIYNTDPTNRTLMGGSLGGLFALYVLFTEPPDQRLFTAFIASSPVIEFVPHLLNELETQMAARSAGLPVILHMSSGVAEGLLTQDCETMANRLMQRGYEGLTLVKSVFPTDHGTNNLPAYFEGLQLVHDGDNPNGLTAANLRGMYDLELTSSSLSNPVVLSGELEVSGNTAVFRQTEASTRTLAVSGDMITLTDSEGNTQSLQAIFTHQGRRLTLVDDEGVVSAFNRRGGTGTINELSIATLQGTYDLDVAVSTTEDFESIVLEIDGNTLAFTLTRIINRGDFLITPNTLTITNHDRSTETWHAAFSHDGNTLTLMETDGSTSIYHRR